MPKKGTTTDDTLVSQSANGNGHNLDGGEYRDGTAKIQLFQIEARG